VFGEAVKAELETGADVKTPHVKIGKLTLKNRFLSGTLATAGLSPSVRK